MADITRYQGNYFGTVIWKMVWLHHNSGYINKTQCGTIVPHEKASNSNYLAISMFHKIALFVKILLMSMWYLVQRLNKYRHAVKILGFKSDAFEWRFHDSNDSCRVTLFFSHKPLSLFPEYGNFWNIKRWFHLRLIPADSIDTCIWLNTLQPKGRWVEIRKINMRVSRGWPWFFEPGSIVSITR